MNRVYEDDWINISDKLDELTLSFSILLQALRPIPNTIWHRECETIKRDINGLKDVLQTRADKDECSIQ